MCSQKKSATVSRDNKNGTSYTKNSTCWGWPRTPVLMNAPAQLAPTLVEALSAKVNQRFMQQEKPS
jgi:hypothetical protein